MINMSDALVECCTRHGLTVRVLAPGIYMVEEFAQRMLQVDPISFLPELDARLPILGKDGEVVAGELQWVTGQHVDLKYRGNTLARRKFWVQDGSVDERILTYSYTGWNNPIALATSDWNADPVLKAVCDR